MSSKKEKVYEVDDLFFKTSDDLKIYLEIKDYYDKDLIKSFDIGPLLKSKPSYSKYNAKKIIIDENVMDSKLEARYYLYLIELKNNKEIKKFDLKPSFTLLPGFKKNGRTFRKITYVADFKVFFNDGTHEIIDTKGKITPEFSLKEKLFEYNYPDESLKVIKWAKWCGGWVEHHIWKKKKAEKKRALKK